MIEGIGLSGKAFGASLVRVLGALLVALVLAVSGVGPGIDNMLFDLGERLLAKSTDEAPNVVLVEIPPQGDTDPSAILQWLEGGEAKMAFVPAAWSDAQVSEGQGSPSTVRYWATIEQPLGGGDLRFDDPAAADIPAERLAALWLPLSEDGITRHWLPTLSVGGRTVRTLEGWAMQEGNPPDTRLRFDLRPEALPRVDVTALIAGAVPREFLAGRILFFVDPALVRQRVVTPLGVVSVAEFHALALRSVNLGGLFQDVSGLKAIVLLLVLGVIGAGGAWGFGQRFGGWFLGGLGVLIVGAVAGGMAFGVLLPVSEMGVLVFGLYLGYRATLAERRRLVLNALARGFAKRMENRVVSQAPQDTEEHWRRILRMVSQTLDTPHAMFLAIDRDANRVREVAAMGCALADITEPRRDIRRTPFSTVLQNLGFTALNDRPFLKVDPAYLQFMVPLVFAGQVQGFWIFTQEQGASETIGERRKVIEGLAANIAERLFQSRLASQGDAETVGSNSLEDEALLRTSAQLLDNRLGLLEAVFQRAHSPAIVFDLYGSAVLINRRMADLTYALALRPFDMTALSFLVDFAGVDPQQGREILGHVSVGGESLRVAVAQEIEGQRYVVGIGALNPQEEENGSDNPMVVMELMNVTELSAGFRMRRLFSNYLNNNLRGDFEAMLLAAKLLARDSLPAEVRGKAFNRMSQVLDRTKGTLSTLAEFLETDEEQLNEESSARRQPVQPVEVVRALVAEMAGEGADGAGIPLQAELPHVSGFCLMEPGMLADGLQGILRVLKQDLRPDGVIRVVACEAERSMTLRFENDGFGIPQERLEHYVFDDSPLVSDDLDDIRGLAKAIQSSGGRFQVESAPGKGMAFEFEVILLGKVTLDPLVERPSHASDLR